MFPSPALFQTPMRVRPDHPPRPGRNTRFVPWPEAAARLTIVSNGHFPIQNLKTLIALPACPRIARSASCHRSSHDRLKAQFSVTKSRNIHPRRFTPLHPCPRDRPENPKRHTPAKLSHTTAAPAEPNPRNTPPENPRQPKTARFALPGPSPRGKEATM